MTTIASELSAAIRSIRDYPKPGIIFRDITTLLGNPRAFRRAVDELVQPYAGMKIDKIAGMEGLHSRRRGGASAVCRFRADPQKGQAAAYHRACCL